VLDTSLNHISGGVPAELALLRVSSLLSSIREELRVCENEKRFDGLPISARFRPPPADKNEQLYIE
jgi:hypothetical protein